MKSASRAWLAPAWGLALLLISGSLQAQINLNLSAPAYQVSPGGEFYVQLGLDSNVSISVGQYEIPVSYNPDVLEVVGVVDSAAGDLGLFKPSLAINRMANNFTIYDSMWGTAGNCSYYAGPMPLALIKMRVKKTAPLGANTGLSIPAPFSRPFYLYDCASHEGIPVAAALPDDVSVVDFVEKTYNLQQYLDVDANYTLGEGDVDIFSEIINKYRYNVGGNYQVKLGGIQMDFRGTARPNVYDLGVADAVARPTRFVRSGDDGICNSLAASSDVHEIAVGRGSPFSIAILPGPNNVLNTTPGEDDTITGMVITTGANGVSESTRAGDDIQAIVIGQGEPNQICVSPGPDGKLATIAEIDDAVLELAKDTGSILGNLYVPPGRPSKIEIVYPPPDNVGAGLIYLPKGTTTPLMVRVVDEFGNPKPGIAPKFEVIAGTAGFQYGGTVHTVLQGQPADQFLTLGNSPEGLVGGLLQVPAYSQSQIQIRVTADPTKGIPADIVKNVWVNCYPSNPPASLSLQFSPSASVGMELPVVITALDESSAPVPGYARRIKLATSRNLANGCLGVYDDDCGIPIKADSFEMGLTNWEISDGSVISVGTYAGWMGDMVVMAGSTTSTIATMSTAVNSASFAARDMKMSFQWRFQNDVAYGSKLVVQYLDNATSSWVNLREIYGPGQLQQGENNFVWEEIDLSSVNLFQMSYLAIRFLFVLQPYEIFYLDNFSLTGFQAVFEEDFESLGIGMFPPTMDHPSYINSGEHGRSYISAPAGDDILRIPYNQGEPLQEAIWPSLNHVLDTTPAGDDESVLIDGNWIINTGANGICDTHAAGDDFQLIAYGDGEPYSRVVLPGLNQILETEGNSYNEVVNPMGPNPFIIVNSSAGGAESTLKAVTLGRTIAGDMADYALEKRLNLAGYQHLYLSFYTKTLNMAQSTSPKPQFVCEVSQDDGNSWVPVWDFEGVDHDWSYHEIPLHNDPRFNLVNDFIIRWRASITSSYTEQNASVDQIRLSGSGGTMDAFTTRTYDMGDGTYRSAITTFTPGTFRIAAVYVPETINYTIPPYDLPIVSDAYTVQAAELKVDPRTVKIMPENFTLNACERMNYLVIGKLSGQSKYSDLTHLYRLEVHGPGRMVKPGIFQADCFVSDDPTERLRFSIRAMPLVSTLYDPGGGGGGGQTGLISGKIFLPNLQGAATASVEVVIPGSGSIYGIANSTGNYIFGTVPVGSNYTVNSLKNGYKLNYKGSVSVTAGNNTTVNIILKTGEDCDGDGTLDSADTDDDGDGISDTMETVKNTQKCKLDSDEDGYGDGPDLFPADDTEWSDSDNDGIGDGDETDDDGDGFDDDEEAALGTDGYITDGREPDTDHDGYTDYLEYSNSTDPTVYNSGAADSDTDGLFNSQEQGGGTCGVSWNKVNTKTSSSDSDTDDDGVDDYDEVYSYNINPACHDTDLDGLHDSQEGSTAVSKPCPYANNYDSDGDGLCDGNTVVMNGSTVLCADGEDLDADKVVDTGETDPCNPDSEGDSMPDGWEKSYSLNPLSNDAASDPDGDSLNNLSEYIYETNPNQADTDGDGINDKAEVDNSLDPKVPNWGTINVSSDPIGAEVYIDGTQLYWGRYMGLSGSTASPLSIGTLKNEKHLVTVVAEDYFIYQYFVDISLGQSYTVNPTLSYRKYEVYTTSAPVTAGGSTVQAASGYSAPHAVDFDKNGTIDLFLGAGNGLVYYYSNASGSTLSLAAGVTVQAASTVLDVGERAKPFVVDWNNDNRLDLLVGNSLGQVWLHTGSGSPNFSAGTQIQAGGTVFTVPGGNAAPVVADWDGDNKKDLIVGGGDGFIYLYHNSGTDAAPVLDSGASISDIDGNPVSAGTFAAPLVGDNDRDGNLDLEFGSADGQLGACFYDSSESGYHCLNPALSTTSSDLTSYIDVGNNAAVSVADINDDSQLDMFIGDSTGSLVYYQSSHLTGDIDRSTKVDAGDWIQVKLSLGLCKGESGYNPGADLNGDNCVTSADLTVLMGNFGDTY